MIAAVVGFSALIAVTLATHHYTKAAYYEVGRNSGSIDASAKVLMRLTEIAGKIPTCSPEQQREGKSVVAVKAEAIYAVTTGPATVSLCFAP
jgi:hypothetical protein